MSPTSLRARTASATAMLAVLTIAACSPPSGESGGAPSERPGSGTPTAAPTAPTEETPLLSNGQPMRAELSIPKIGLSNLVVVPYRGWTDDGPSTEIQNTGRAASPHGPRGGTGPGGVGNYQVTAHRLSSTRAFLRLPELERGDRVRVRTENATYVYRITRTRRTSFRSPESLRAQRAAVPGEPGQEPTRAMITLSTCATPEDHAAGNYWFDEFDNPEHRIDKIGVLLAIR